MEAIGMNLMQCYAFARRTSQKAGVDEDGYLNAASVALNLIVAEVAERFGRGEAREFAAMLRQEGNAEYSQRVAVIKERHGSLTSAAAQAEIALLGPWNYAINKIALGD